MRFSFLRSGLLGSVDGLVTSFAIVAASSFLDTPVRVVGVVGSASLVADGVSMGISEYLSTRGAALLTTQSGLPDVYESVRSGLVCGVSFVVGGTAPLLIYTLGDGALLGAGSASLVVLLVIGLLRSFVTGGSVVSGTLEVVALGVVASGVAFGVAYGSSEALD